MNLRKQFIYMKMFKLFIFSLSGLWFSSLIATTTISAESAVINKQDNIATYSGNVEFSSEEIYISAEELVVKQINKSGYHITATSDKLVQFSRKNASTSARAQNITYITHTGDVTLLGQAVINLDGDVLTGEHIDYNTKTNNAKIKGTKNTKVRFELDL